MTPMTKPTMTARAEERMSADQTIDVTLAGASDALAYVKDLEGRGFNVKFTNTLVGSNWWWRIEANKPRLVTGGGDNGENNER